MKLVLDPIDWHRAGLGDDPEALAWLAELDPDAGDPNGSKVIWLELAAEGAVYHYQFPRSVWPVGRWGSVLLCPSCETISCWCEGGSTMFVAVRRRWTGPVPSQVLAAFRPDEVDR